MISVETTLDGFSLSIDGKRILTHSQRHSCLEIGTAYDAPGRVGGRKYRRIQVRSYKIEESSPDLVVVNFEGRLRMAARLAGGKLRVSFSRYSDEINRFKFMLAAVPEESIYGCGERYDRLDLKGSRVSLWVESRGRGRWFNPYMTLIRDREKGGGPRSATYFPQPSFISSETYWVHVETSSYSRFDFRNPRISILEVWGIPREIVIGWGASPSEAVAGLSAHLGRAPVPPDWTRKGVWLGVQGGVPEVRRKLNAARGAGMPVGSVWIRDWCGLRSTRYGSQVFWNWKPDTSLYPNLNETISSLRAEGVRCLGYINPFLAIQGDLYAEASGKGFCVLSPGGGDYIVPTAAFPAALLDLTNPQAVQWIKDLIRREMIGAGMSGWMADFGDYLPEDAILHSGESAGGMHNRWPVLWARVNREAIDEAGKRDEIVVFLRSGWSGSSALASGFWAGCQLPSLNAMDGLASVIHAGISAGISGAGFWHFDIGGCVNIRRGARGEECLMRWAEVGAFTPIFRTHEGNRPEANRQFWSTSALLKHFARMTEIYAALGPYHEQVSREFTDAGLPPLRHLWMHYPDDREARRTSSQYLYGRDILVAPVLREGQKFRKTYLPQDNWIHFWTSQSFQGGWITLEAPLGYPAVFYRESSRYAPVFDSIRLNARRR